MRLVEVPGAVYARAARARRAWYARHPDRRRRLARPVISVGNLAVGGSRKTPAVRYLATILLAAGERPSILSRGYAREVVAEGVVVVSDGARILADVRRAGDEPLMLARSLPGTAVFVCADRALAGRLSERRFGVTVHLLDDGFQHFGLERDVDLLLVSAEDLRDARTLPFGRLREPIDAARAADALIVHGAAEPLPADLAAAGLERHPIFHLDVRIRAARAIEGGARVGPDAGAALLVTGIARPEGFRAAVADAGWQIAGELRFGDHQPFGPADVRAIAAEARRRRADLVLTTEKDMTRLQRHRPLGLPVAWVPLDVSIEPGADFARWLAARLARAQGTRLRAQG